MQKTFIMVKYNSKCTFVKIFSVSMIKCTIFLVFSHFLYHFLIKNGIYKLKEYIYHKLIFINYVYFWL